ncbi:MULTISPECIES: hypothetical protein [Gluconobacter]|uniref:hypothetical protein n=1 Tax=Gluconobacter TaxID=441 RepID=UPI000776B2E8|nr:MULTISPECIES: hypothetical protein [Gluconobacter]MBS1072529.1 hypothetical protein [Gluconobacter cerinus]GLP89931.1 hypothetical protein GCM10007868_10060 [Gluconobacter frateurii]
MEQAHAVLVLPESSPREARYPAWQIDATLIARFMVVRPEVGRTLRNENLQILCATTVRRVQMVTLSAKIKRVESSV